MDNNNLLMIILAFVVGYCLQGMMKNMCGDRLFEGVSVGDGLIENSDDCEISAHNSCQSGYCKTSYGGNRGRCAPMPPGLVGKTNNKLWASEYKDK